MRREDGFTLIELLAACAVMAIALTLGAYSIRSYWQARALSGSVDQVVSELRAKQQDASTATHPWVYGVWFKADSSNWGVVRASSQTGDCELLSRRTFDSGVEVASAAFDDIVTQTMTAKCVTATEPGAEVAFFFARGTATGGTVSLSHPQVSGGAAKTIRVYPVTGKVERT